MGNMCKDCANWNGIGFAENAGWCEKKDIPVLYNDKCDDDFKNKNEVKDCLVLSYCLKAKNLNINGNKIEF